MIEQDPKTKPETPPVRTVLPDVDEQRDLEEDIKMRGWDYNPFDDPENLEAYLEPYQNDYDGEY